MLYTGKAGRSAKFYIFRPSAAKDLRSAALAIANPSLCQFSLSLGRSRSIATRLIDLEKPIVGPAVRGGAIERLLELILRLGKPPRLQQRGSERLAQWIVAVGWLSISHATTA
jgi:hypothetical protein